GAARRGAHALAVAEQRDLGEALAAQSIGRADDAIVLAFGQDQATRLEAREATNALETAAHREAALVRAGAAAPLRESVAPFAPALRAGASVRRWVAKRRLSACSTLRGTSPWMGPPWRAISLTRVELR